LLPHLPDPVLGELLAHYGLEAFESMLAADKFGIDNLLHVQTEKEFDGFFEHFGVTGFLHQNRFKTMIAAIPGSIEICDCKLMCVCSLCVCHIRPQANQSIAL
jgi:hypothetical protein